MTLRIALLGKLQLNRDGRPLELPGHRPPALLTYLLLTGQAQSRQHLTELLFEQPDDPRGALRWTLSQLRKAVGADAILSDRQMVAFNFDTDYWFDAASFEAGDFDLYRGELLQEIYVRDAGPFNAWLLVERERLRGLYQSGLEDRLQEELGSEDFDSVEQTALKLLALDDLREDWHRALMIAFARQGKFTAAQAQYDHVCQILARELDLEPAQETADLAESIKKEQANHSLMVSRMNGLPQQEALIPGLGPGQRSPSSAGRRNWFLTPLILIASAAGLALIVLLAFDALSGGRSLSSIFSTGPPTGQVMAGKMAGTTVTIAVPLGGEELDLFMQSMRSFEEQSGIEIEIGTFQGNLEQILPSVVDSGLAPDIISIAQPGLLAEFVSKEQVVDVRSFLDEAYLQQQYSPALLQAAIIDGQMAGVWHRNNIKSLVWYPKAAFVAAGYKVPQTWDELIALSAQIIADGAAPWCIGIESGAATGWIGTDWVEDILLRTAPPETFDAWVAGIQPFDSPELWRTMAIMDPIWRDDRFVYGGRNAVLTTPFTESALSMLEEPPGCFLHKQGSFLLEFFPEEAVFGEDYDFFYLPAIDPAFGKPVLGGGDMMVMFNDRPEVRETMRYLTTADSVRYFVENGGTISPHRDTPFEWYDSTAQLRMAQILLEADTYRFDGSDAMPPQVGAGSFWQGIVSWTGGADTRKVLQEIDQSWPKEK